MIHYSLLERYVREIRRADKEGELTAKQRKALLAIRFPFVPKYGRKRPVVCLETGETFPSVAAAGRAKQCVKTTISHALAGKDPLEMKAGGYHWMWADDWDAADKRSRDDLRRRMEEPALRKRFVCVETGEVFDSIEAAAERFNVGVGSLRKSCYRNDPDRPIRGLHWYDMVEYPKLQRARPELIRRWRIAYITNGVTDNRKYGPVTCVETGREFKSAREAAEWLVSENLSENMTGAKVYVNLSRNDMHRAAYGYHWADPEWLENVPERDRGLVEDVRAGRKVQPSKIIPVRCVTTGEEFESMAAAVSVKGVYLPRLRRAVYTGEPLSDGSRWEPVQ